MGMSMRVSLPGYNALTDTNPTHYSVFADSDNVLIKEFARGSITINSLDDDYIEHNLGYAPKFIVFVNTGTNTYEMVNGFNIYAEFRAYTTSTRLYLENLSGSNRTFKYYIFYDNEDNG